MSESKTYTDSSSSSTLTSANNYTDSKIAGLIAPTGDVESEVFQVKRYVDAMIRYHLGNQYKFSSMAQACEMPDLPPDAMQLKGKLNLTLTAMKFRKVRR